MLDETDSGAAPWTVVATDDKKTARLNIIRHILTTLNRPGHTADKPDKDALFPAAKSKGKLAE